MPKRAQFWLIFLVSHNVFFSLIVCSCTMKVLSVIIALCSLIAVAIAGQSVLLNATHPDHPDKCYDSFSKLELNFGETKSVPGSCTEAFCSKDFTITYTTCILFTLDDPNCEKVEQDFSKDYPECCKKYKCVHDGKVSYH